MTDEPFQLTAPKPARPKFRVEIIQAHERTHQRPLFIGADDLAGQAYLFDAPATRENPPENHKNP